MAEDCVILEAVLFCAGKPLSVSEIAKCVSWNEKRVKDAIKELVKIYKKRKGALEVTKAGNKYVMQVKAELYRYASKFAPGELSQSLLKTLSLIAYHQPVKQSHLIKMLGVKVYEHVKTLQNKKLITAKPHGSTKILETTSYFSEYFGIGTTDKKKIKKWIASKLSPDEKRLTQDSFSGHSERLEQ